MARVAARRLTRQAKEDAMAEKMGARRATVCGGCGELFDTYAAVVLNAGRPEADICSDCEKPKSFTFERETWESFRRRIVELKVGGVTAVIFGHVYGGAKSSPFHGSVRMFIPGTWGSNEVVMANSPRPFATRVEAEEWCNAEIVKIQAKVVR